MTTTQANLDLHQLANAVTEFSVYDGARGVSARQAARCMSGIVNLVQRQHGVYAMQRACGELVRDARAWSSNLTILPRGADGRIDPALEHIAIVARGMLAIAGVEAMKSALAFWAVETDPAVWQRVAA
jgi:hypothetical protein